MIIEARALINCWLPLIRNCLFLTYQVSRSTKKEEVDCRQLGREDCAVPLR
jgi:hypothetical protein